MIFIYKLFAQLFFLYSNKRNIKIIRSCYLRVLEREPDPEGLNYFLYHMSHFRKTNRIDKYQLIKLLKNSDEGRKIILAKSKDRKAEYIFKGLNNIKYLVRPNSALDNKVVLEGIYNKWLCLKLQTLIKDDSVIFDIGANAGLLTLPFAKICAPKGKVYSFEPDSFVIKQLQKNVQLNKLSNVYINEIALQDNPKINEITLNINRAVQDEGLRNDGLSTLENRTLYKIGSAKVNSSIIDKFIEENSINRLDFIKIDVEGAEYRVLKGGEKTIRKFNPIIFYEHISCPDKSNIENNVKKSFQFIKNLGYRQFLICNNAKNKIIEMKNYSTGFKNDGDIICFKDKSYLNL